MCSVSLAVDVDTNSNYAMGKKRTSDTTCMCSAFYAKH